MHGAVFLDIKINWADLQITLKTVEVIKCNKNFDKLNWTIWIDFMHIVSQLSISGTKAIGATLVASVKRWKFAVTRHNIWGIETKFNVM